MNIKDFDFMYNKSGLSRYVLGFLTNDEEFRDLFEKRNRTDNWARTREELDLLIYNIICKIYFPLNVLIEKDKKSLSKEDISRISQYRNAIKKTSKIIFNDNNHWKKDYEKYLEEGDTNE